MVVKGGKARTGGQKTLPQDPGEWSKSQMITCLDDWCSLGSYLPNFYRVLLKSVYDIFERERSPEKDIDSSCICSLDVFAVAKAGGSQ